MEASQAAAVLLTADDKQCAASILGLETANWTMAKELSALASLAL